MRAKRLKKRSQTWQKPIALSLFSLFTLGASSALLATEPLPEEASREEPPEIPATAWSFGARKCFAFDHSSRPNPVDGD